MASSFDPFSPVPAAGNGSAYSPFEDDYGDDVQIGVLSADPEPFEPSSFFVPEANGGDPSAAPPSAVLEWRRQNAIILEEKEITEKELRNKILEEAEEYKQAFLEKRILNNETKKTHNREREKIFIAHQENFYANADKQYWKSISELIPNEIGNIEKKGKKGLEKKPSVAVINSPKPGKPTDLSRMRQILLKLKHTTPPHLKLVPAGAQPADGAGISQVPVVAASN